MSKTINLLTAADAADVFKNMLAPLVQEIQRAVEGRKEIEAKPIYVSKRTAAYMLDCSDQQIEQLAKKGHLNKYYPPGTKGNPRYAVAEIEQVYKPLGKDGAKTKGKLKPFRKQRPQASAASGE